MKINDIAKEIAKREGKKSQARIGDIKEILGIIADMIYDNYKSNNYGSTFVYTVLLHLGFQRAKKRNAKKRVNKAK